MSKSRYPENWEEIAFQIKEAAQWRCAKCGMPGEDVSTAILILKKKRQDSLALIKNICSI